MARIKTIALSSTAKVISVLRNLLGREDEGDRVTVWSISSFEAGMFFPWAILMWIAGLTYFIYDEQVYRAENITPEEIVTVVERFGFTVIPTVAIAMIISALTTRAWRIVGPPRRYSLNFLERFENWLVRPYHERGRTEGRTKAIAEYEGWLNRKAQAEAEGLPFDELPPQPTPETPPEQ